MLAGGDFAAIRAFDDFIQGLPVVIKEIHVLGFGIHSFLIDFTITMMTNVFVQHSDYFTSAERTDFVVFFLKHSYYPTVNLLENITMLAPRAVKGNKPQKFKPEKYEIIAAREVPRIITPNDHLTNGLIMKIAVNATRPRIIRLL